MSDENQAAIEGRRAPRVQLDRKVTIRIGDHVLVGNGQNISEQGVFFVAEGRVPVEVEIEGRDGPLTGELVRTENMGAGQLGIAVRFDEAHPDLVDAPA
ncbi:MAG: PilZ domain-containing protein [Planctomycetota bacterium]